MKSRICPSDRSRHPESHPTDEHHQLSPTPQAESPHTSQSRTATGSSSPYFAFPRYLDRNVDRHQWASERVTGSCRSALVGRDCCDDLTVQVGVTTRPWIVDDGLWAVIEPLLPPWPERSPGPNPVPDRLCLQGILYVLYQDIAWQLLPLELGFGSGQTCWRRLDRWQQAGVFDQLHRILLAKLNAAGELDWSRAYVDGSHILLTLERQR